jgi:hypothetical protein
LANLNEGVASFVFLCVKYGTKGAQGSYISELTAEAAPAGTLTSTLCNGSGETRLAGNLNAGISNNPDTINFCVVRDSGPALKEIRFVVSTEEKQPLSSSALTSRCRGMFGFGANVEAVDTDLNSGVTTSATALGNIGAQSPKAIQTCTGYESPAVGIVEVAAPALTVAAGQPFAYEVRWTVPVGMSWRDLESVELRLSDGERDALWLRFDESTAAVSVVDAAGSFGPAVGLGTGTVLAGYSATVNLGGTAVVGSGPTGQFVTLRLWLTFYPHAAGQTYTASVLARADDGRTQEIQDAGVLQVAAPATS